MYDKFSFWDSSIKFSINQSAQNYEHVHVFAWLSIDSLPRPTLLSNVFFQFKVQFNHIYRVITTTLYHVYIAESVTLTVMTELISQ